MKLPVLIAMLMFLPIWSRAFAQGNWPLFENYARHFVDPQGKVMDPDRNGMVTSEAQSYALFFSLVANDPNRFREILDWTQKNLAQGDLSQHLPAWSWGKKPDNSWGILDGNSASDADLWVAYSLLEAGRLWGNSAYSVRGKQMLSLIARYEVVNVPLIGMVMIPGRTGFVLGHETWILNPAYLPMPLLLGAGREDPAGPWTGMAAHLPMWFESTTVYGFAMDWVKCGASGCSPAKGPDDRSSPALGSYDAIRVYLWAGMMPKDMTGAAKLLSILSPMSTYVRQHGGPPQSVGPNGTVISPDAPVGFVAAVIPFMQSAGSPADSAQLQRTVQSYFSSSTGLFGSPPKYYDQNLALFGLGWRERRFWFRPDGSLGVQWKK
jgi:endo-1,4-beta-D-glucanase Y